MLHIVLFEPEIPPNTGNIIRLCANTGFALHLIKPLGFCLDDKQLRRAGLDYHEWAQVQQYDSLAAFMQQVQPSTLYALSTKAKRTYSDAHFKLGDALLFGPESRGLPEHILTSLPQSQCLRLPMQRGSRSLNLSNTVAILTYTAWQQFGFAGAVLS